MRLFLLITFSLLINLLATAQNTNHRIRCYTDEVYQQQISSDTTLKNSYEAAALQTRNLANNIIVQRSKSGNSAPLYIVPVVVHVVYNNASHNVSDTAIYTQIQRLNDDYRRINFDTANTRALFKGIAVDTKIEFRLAERDPNGNATTGIIRKQTSNASFSQNDNVKHSNLGGDDAWPACSYLNIWTCNLGGGLLGYSQFPGGPTATDGVVILDSAFGQKGIAASPYDIGRTVTHEVGHWLNLYHPFQGGCAGMTASNCGSQGDDCCDTPPVSAANYGCPPATTNSCNETYMPRVDMWEDYMDYTDDACMNAFTANQTARMQATLAGTRNCINSSTALTSVNGSTPVLSVNKAVICAGSSVTLTVSGANNYYWTPYTGLNTTSGSTVIASPKVTTVYTIYGTNTACNCGAWIQDTIVVLGSAANLNVIPTTFCAGSKPVLTVSGATNYTWSPSTGISNAYKDTVTAYFTTNSTYTITTHDTIGNTVCTSSKNISFVVNPMPNANFNASAVNNVTVAFTTTGGTGFTYNWNFGDGSSSTNQNPTHSFANDTTYQVCLIVKNANNTCTDTSCQAVNLKTLGINRVDFLNSISIVPNPASNQCLVSFDLTDKTHLKMEMVDVLGRKLFNVTDDNFNNGHHQLILNLSALSNGIYFLKIENNQNRFVKKIVKE